MTILAYIVKYLALLLPLLLIWWEYRLKYVDKDGRTTEHKRARTIVLFLGICICVSGLVSTTFDDSAKAKKERSLAESNTNLTQQLNAIREAQTNLPGEVFRGVNQGVTKLLSQATNSALGDAALSATIQDIAATIREKEKTVEKFEAINTDSSDVSAWKVRYENRLELAQLNREKTNQEAELARRETEKVNREAELAAQKAAKEASEKAAQEAKQQENYVSEKTRPVFDYAIRNLLTLVAHARQNSEAPVTTYKGLPSVIDSPTQEIGQISAGDKPTWLYGIFITQSPRTLVVRCVDVNPSSSNALILAQRFISRDLMSVAKAPYEKSIVRQPLNTLLRFKYVITLTISFPDQNFESVSTSMVVRSKSAEPFPSVEDKQSYNSYTKCIDVALGNLVGAHAVVVDHLPK